MHVLQFCVLLVVFAAQSTVGDANYLKSYGANVCSRSRYVTTYVTSQAWRTGYSDYYAKCGVWGWSRCKRTRTYRIYYYTTSSRSKLVYNYYCCSGWTQSSYYSSSCSKPICSSGCAHGYCSSPESCSCNSGWGGYTCSDDINECHSSNGGCQQLCTNTQGSYRCGCRSGYKKISKHHCSDVNECDASAPCRCASNAGTCGAKCTNTDGSYYCSCGSGFQLVSGNICKDYDECASGSHDCAQTCVNLIGSYTCVCRQGYLSSQNGTNCTDINECQKANGECEHTCKNIPGSWTCLCNKGYRLESNNRTCQDIDECSENNPCHHNCTNLVGSYKCSCKDGYKLNYDMKSCSDIDECSSSSHQCEQTCNNTEGSYTCGCRAGYKLNNDRRTCTDINECTLGLHRCTQKCVNTVGGYQCYCTQGYDLAQDGKTCHALPCEPINSPSHGSMTCTSMVSNGNCTFSCNDGYSMKGSPNITCMITSQWSDRLPTCQAKTCGRYSPPRHVVLSLPCYTFYGSSCDLRCLTGFYSTGNSKVSCALTQNKLDVMWQNDFQCHRVGLCKPNPCKHEGTCVITSSKHYKCNCSNTGYTGTQCQKGVIVMPTFTKLKPNLQSKPLTIHAKPSSELAITLQSDDNIVSKPRTLTLSKSKPQSSFTVTPKKPGLDVISYSIQGKSASDFITPDDTVVFTGAEAYSNGSIFTTLPILPEELPVGCHVINTSLFQCNVQLSSTLPWTRNGANKIQTTKGIVHVVSKQSKIPLSLFGMLSSLKRHEIIKNINEVNKRYNENIRIKLDDGQQCSIEAMTQPQLLELVEHDSFTSSFLNMLLHHLPPWLYRYNPFRSTTFDLNKIFANIGPNAITCSSFLNSSNIITFKSSSDKAVSTDEDAYGFCLAVDVCTSEVSVRLPKTTVPALAVQSFFQNLKGEGWEMEVIEAMFSGGSPKRVAMKAELWDGTTIVGQKAQDYQCVVKGTMRVTLQSKHNKVQLEYNGDVYVNTSHLQTAFHYWFERTSTTTFKGKAAFTLTTMAFRQNINITFSLQQVVGTYTFGGKAPNQRMSFQLHDAKDPFQNTPLASSLQPDTNNPFYLVIQHGITGGQVLKIDNVHSYNMKITLLSLLLSQLKLNILNNPQVGHVISSKSKKRWKNDLKEAENVIKDVRGLVFLPVSSYDIGKLLLLHNKLKQHIEKVRYLCTLLQAASVLKGTVIVAQLRQMKSNIPQLPDLQYTRSPIAQRFQGFKLRFDGRICIQRICFPVTPLTLESGHTNKEISGPEVDYGVIIQGEVMKDIHLDKVLILQKHSRITLKIPREEILIHVTFRPKVNLFGIHKTVPVSIINDTMTFQTSGLLFGKYQGTITAKSKLNVADWPEMKYHIKVTMQNDTGLPLKLQRKLNNYIREMAAKATERVASAEQVAREHQNKLQDFKKSITKLTREYANYEKEKRRQSIRLKRAKIGYFSLKNSKIPDIIALKKDQTYCTPCPKICSKTKVCTFKSKKLEINETKHRCDIVNVEQERTEFVTRRYTSYYLKKTFRTVYTGNCYMRDIVELIINVIFGCDNTYRSEPGPDKIVSFTAVREVPVRKKISVKKYVCNSYIEKRVTNSFEPPQMVCNGNGCVKVVDPNCTLQTIECINRLKLLRKTQQDSKFDKEKQTLILELQYLANKMEMASMDLEKIIANCTKAQERLKLAKAQIKHLEYAANRSNTAVTEIKTFPSTKFGYYLSTILQTAQNRQPISVSNLKFDAIITKTKAKLPLTFTVASLDGKYKEMSFLFNFNDDDISLYKMTKTIVSTMFEENQHAGRLRRSIPEENEEKHTGGKKRHCFLARKVHSYYNSIVKSLKKLIVNRRKFLKSNEADVQKLQFLRERFVNISQSQIKENITNSPQEVRGNTTDTFQGIINGSDFNQDSKGNDSNHSLEIKDNSQKMIQACVNFVESMLDDKTNHNLQTWNQTMNGWKAFLEVLTNETSFQDCASVHDCVTSMGEELNELYLYESDFESANEVRRILNNATNELTGLISNNFTEEESVHKLTILEWLLNQSFDTNVLCGDEPNIVFSSREELVVLRNDKLVLKCIAKSDTPVTYEWIHKNASVQQSVNGTLIIENVNFTHAGGYQCKASNRKGFVTSNVTMITINSKPEITQHPRDTKAYVNDGIGLLLWCNATGEPFPGIEWYYVSHRPNSTETKLENDNSTSLYYENITEDQSGFYFCKVSNPYGHAESRKARVWVLEMSPGQPRVSVYVNVTRICKSKKMCSSRNNIDASRERARLDQKLSASLNSLQRQITDMQYNPSGDFRTAVVSFTYKTNIPTRQNNTDSFYDPFLESFARKRRDLSEGLQGLYHSMINGTFSAAIDDVELTGDVESLRAKFIPPGCPQGQEPHSNGYMCVFCPPGTYNALIDGNCKPCPVKTYQYLSGQSKCFSCDRGFTTKYIGSLVPQDCYDMSPSPPRNLKAVPVGSTRLDLTWEKPKVNSQTVIHYLIKYSVLKKSPRTLTVPKNVSTWILRGLRKFTEYRIVIYAVNRHGMNKSQIDTKTGEDIPDAGPYIIKADPISHDSIRVTWRPIPERQRNGIISHRIYYRTLSSDTYQWMSHNCTQTGNTNTCVVPGLKPFTWYCVKMTVFTSKGEYPRWNRRLCYKLRTPSPPINVTGIALNSSQIRLTFTTVSGYSRSHIVNYGERKENLLYTKVCALSGCVLEDLEENTLYYIKMLGVTKEKGESANIIQVRTKKNDPTALTPVVGKALSSSQIQLRFYSTNDRSIIIHYGINLDFLESGKECLDTCTIGGLKENTLYYIKAFGLSGGKPVYTVQIRTKKRG